MKKAIILIWVAAIVGPLNAQTGRPGGPPCAAGPGTTAPIAGNPVVNLTGTISGVHLARGEGTPYLEVKTSAETTKVYLGSMRYLISENFSPKAGQPVTLKGYQLKDSVMAIEVTLPSENKTLKLRDENGWPLWRGGPWRGAGRNRP